MSNIAWFCICIVVGVLSCKYGKWSKELEMFDLQNDNTRLSGEAYRLRKQLIKTESLFFGPPPPTSPIEDIKELEEIPWD
jgi:hypothetical protein